jgi:virulence plasmid B protein
MRRDHPDRGTSAMGACILGLAMLVGGNSFAGGSESVSGFSGSFSQGVPIEVPGFRGLEPRLALGYSSQGRGGFPGVGWGLAGFSVVERASPGLGAPHYDSMDVYVLNGQELIACQTPNCTTGGTHTTKVESYLRITLAGSTWTVVGKDGTRTILTPTFTTPSGTLAWGQTSVVDTHGKHGDLHLGL